MILQTEYKTASDAIDQVSKGNAWSAVVIEERFTFSLFQRICDVAPDECRKLIPINPNDTIPPVTQEVIDESTVHLYSDLSGKILLYNDKGGNHRHYGTNSPG